MQQTTTFTLTISRVDSLLFRGDAQSVTLPSASGQLTILAKHEPLIALLKKGIITVRTGGEEKQFEIEKGLLEASNSHVTVLV
jgi:F-type H+-transporting ATPase subunit epsilon